MEFYRDKVIIPPTHCWMLCYCPEPYYVIFEDRPLKH